MADPWAGGKQYERFMGRWSRSIAEIFLAWLDRPAGGRWLDVGCGTGELSRLVMAASGPDLGLGLDFSPQFASHAARSSGSGRLSFAVADAMSLPVAESTFDTAVSALALNFFPNPLAAAWQMKRVVRPGGVVAAYVWDYAGEMGFLRRFWDAAVALDPATADLDEGRRFPLCQPKPLTELFSAAGLEAVTVRSIDVPTVFRDFEDFWSPFLGRVGPAPGYVAALTPEKRIRLADRLRQTLSIEPDGSISLMCRAWAVSGRKAVFGA